MIRLPEQGMLLIFRSMNENPDTLETEEGCTVRIWKLIFSVLVIVFAVLGLMNIISHDISSPAMFVFMGLTLLVNAKEYYDRGAKRNALFFALVAVFAYVFTAYDLIRKFL